MKPIYVACVAVALIFANCATVIPIVTQQEVYIPPLPARVDLPEVTWEVINVDTNTYFALDAENYKNLSKSITDTTAYIAKLRTIIYSLQHTNLVTTNVTKKPFSVW